MRDFIEIVSGTNNMIVKAYQEAEKAVDTNENNKGLTYLKNFITSIESLASKDSVKDERISSSKGNIRNFKGYNNIKTAMSFIDKNLKGVALMSDLSTLFDCLERYQPQYSEGYEKNVRLIVLEYEAGVYMLVTGLSMIMANNMEVTQTGTEIKIHKREGSTYNVIPKTASKMAKEMDSKNHKQYLEEMLKGAEKLKSSSAEVKKKADKDPEPKTAEKKLEESVMFAEAAVSDTINLVDTMVYNAGRIFSYTKHIAQAIKNSVFGIVPLIRSCLYLRYKKKADTVLALEQQVAFIERNIEQLENIKTMDPTKKEAIIRKQKGVIEQYKKRAEKLRAELSDSDTAAAESIKKEDPEMKKDNDDFVLEGVTVPMFLESIPFIDGYTDKYFQEAFDNPVEAPKPVEPSKEDVNQIRAAGGDAVRAVDTMNRQISKLKELDDQDPTGEKKDRSQYTAELRKSVQTLIDKKEKMPSSLTKYLSGALSYWIWEDHLSKKYKDEGKDAGRSYGYSYFRARSK